MDNITTFLMILLFGAIIVSIESVEQKVSKLDVRISKLESKVGNS